MLEQVLDKQVDKEVFINAKKRPGIVVLKQFSLGTRAIGRDKVNQADGFVQDIEDHDDQGKC